MNMEWFQSGNLPYQQKQIDGLSLASVIAICRSHRRSITIWCVVGAVIVTLVTFSLTPRYLARVELMLDTRVQHLSNFGVMSGPLTLADPTPIIRTEEQVLKSTSLASDIIDELKLN